MHHKSAFLFSGAYNMYEFEKNTEKHDVPSRENQKILQVYWRIVRIFISFV